MVRFTWLGGAGEIGASCAWVEAGCIGLVVDCGLRPSVSGSGAYPDLGPIAASHARPAAVILTHAHADHTGALPLLHRRFPDLPVYATEPTIRITEMLLADSLLLSERDFIEAPEWNAADLTSLVTRFCPVAFGETTIVAEDDSTRIAATLFRAGHVMGAACVLLDITETTEQGEAATTRLLFSGDVSLFDQPTIPGTDIDALSGCEPDVLFVEGTYGSFERKHPIEMEEARFAAQVAATLSAGGKVVVPAFAIGRAQNIAIILRRAMMDPTRVRELLGDASFLMPDVPIYVDGMCRGVAEQYNCFRSLLHEDLRAESTPDGHVFFDDDMVRSIRSRDQRFAVAASDEPCIIISSSGMMIGGAVMHYVKEIANDPASAILISGYVDEESGAHRVLHARKGGERSLYIEGEKVVLKCQVAQYRLGAHSDAAELERFCRAVGPTHVQIVHGEPSTLATFARRLEPARKTGNGASFASVAPAVAMSTFEVLPNTVRNAVQTAASTTSEFGTVQQAESLIDSKRTSFFGPSTSNDLVIATLLRAVPDSGYTVSNLARLRYGAPVHGPLSQADVARAMVIVRSDPDRWASTLTGASQQLFRPVTPKPDDTTSAEENGRSRALPSASTHVWKRMETAGIKAGDLVLIEQEGFISPAYLVARIGAFGFRALSALTGATLLSPERVLARVGPWLDYGAQSANMERLRNLYEAVARYEREHLSPKVQASGGVDRRTLEQSLEFAYEQAVISQLAREMALLLADRREFAEGVSPVRLSLMMQDVYGYSDEWYEAYSQLQAAGIVEVRESAAGPLHSWRREQAASTARDHLVREYGAYGDLIADAVEAAIGVRSDLIREKQREERDQRFRKSAERKARLAQSVRAGGRSDVA